MAAFHTQCKRFKTLMTSSIPALLALNFEGSYIIFFTAILKADLCAKKPKQKHLSKHLIVLQFFIDNGWDEEFFFVFLFVFIFALAHWLPVIAATQLWEKAGFKSMRDSTKFNNGAWVSFGQLFFMWSVDQKHFVAAFHVFLTSFMEH